MHPCFCLKPSRGSGVAFGSRAPYGAGRLRRRPRFARLGLASLGLAELRKWRSSAGIAWVAVLERKMQSDDGKIMKFMISFEALWKLVSEEVVMHECLRALDAQTIIFVVPESSWRSNHHIRIVCERLAPEALYL